MIMTSFMFYWPASLHKLVNKAKLVYNLSYYVYSLHVSGDYVPIIRRNNCIYAALGTCYSVWMTVWYAGAYASGDYVPIIRRNNCNYATLGTCYSVWMAFWYAGWNSILRTREYVEYVLHTSVQTVVQVEEMYFVGLYCITCSSVSVLVNMTGRWRKELKVVH